METLTGKLDISEIKRGYAVLPIEYVCPQCESVLKNDLTEGDSYIIYPAHDDEDHDTHFYCKKCDDKEEKIFEYRLPVKVIKSEITIEFDRTKILPA